MTHPPAASHIARSPHVGPVALRPIRSGALSRLVSQVLGPHGWTRLRLLVDIVMVGLASSAAMFAAPLHLGAADFWWFGVGFPVIALTALYARSSPSDGLGGSVLETVTHVFGVVSLAAMVALALDSLLTTVHPIGLTIRLWLFTGVYVGLARAVLLSLRQYAMRLESVATPTLIVGAGVVGEHLVRRLRTDPRYGLRPVGFLDSQPLRRHTPGRSRLPLLGTPDELGETIDRTGARHVIIAFSTEPDHVLVEQVRLCQERGIEVSLVPRLFESVNERATLHHVGGLPLVSLRPTDPRSWQFAVKHAFDRSVAFVGLLALAPLFGAIALLVRTTSRGPAFFRQRRVGRDGQVFDLLKFRTMRQAPADLDFELPNGCAPGGVEGADRRTPLGRLLRSASLDELPQLLNVLRGEMSLIGPRPERPEFVARFSGEVDRYHERHRVKSGITGWAQVCGLRGQTSIADRVEWDNYYVNNWSLHLDLRILLLTVVEVLRFRDSWQERRENNKRAVGAELTAVPEQEPTKEIAIVEAAGG